MTTIMLIEDGSALRRVLSNLLHQQFPDLYVAEVRSGEEALEIVDLLLPDIILLELIFPEGIGLHIAKQLRKRLPNVVLIVFLEPDSPRYRKMAYAAGVDHILSKHSSFSNNLLPLIGSHL